MYRQSEKNPVKHQYLLHMSLNTANFGPLRAEIGSAVCGSTANFNGFRILPSLVHRRRSTEVNQTLHDVWPSPGLVHNIYTFGGSCPLAEFCPVQNSLYVQVLRFHILAVLLHGILAAGVSQTVWRATRNGIKAKFHYAILVADRPEAGRRPVTDLQARSLSHLLMSSC